MITQLAGNRRVGRIFQAGFRKISIFSTSYSQKSSQEMYTNIGMTRISFMRTKISINNGTTVYFRNPADGVTQILCVGVNQDCQAENGDPSQLDGGLVIQPGQTINVAFDTDGNYQITSKTTPNMNLTINVTTPDNSGGD